MYLYVIHKNKNKIHKYVHKIKTKNKLNGKEN